MEVLDNAVCNIDTLENVLDDILVHVVDAMRWDGCDDVLDTIDTVLDEVRRDVEDVEHVENVDLVEIVLLDYVDVDVWMTYLIYVDADVCIDHLDVEVLDCGLNTYVW